MSLNIAYVFIILAHNMSIIGSDRSGNDANSDPGGGTDAATSGSGGGDSGTGGSNKGTGSGDGGTGSSTGGDTGGSDDEWPKLSCYKQYDHKRQTIFKKAQTVCKDGTTERNNLTGTQNISDSHGCILWQLKAITIAHGSNGSKVYEYEDNKGIRKNLNIIFGELYQKKLIPMQNAKRKNFVYNLLTKSEHCQRILDDLANVQKLPSPQWTPFYECINNAWKCKDKEKTT